MLWLGLEISPSGILPAAVMLALGTAALAACGFLLAAAVRNSKAVTAVGLGIALPLAFFSDVFAVGQTPAWMGTVGSFLPLKHLANSVSAALDPAGSTVSWVGLAVLTAWLLVAGYVGVRSFRWTPRHG